MSETGKTLSAQLRAEAMAGALPGYHGNFTLALEKAREKMKNFQLPDPRYYILQLVQAIVASQAEQLHVTHEVSATSYRIVMEFDGPGYTAHELQNLYDHLFTSQAERAKDRLRELALGVASCQALSPRLVVVASGGVAWQRSATPDLLGRLSVSEQVCARTAPEGRPPNKIEIAGQGFDVARGASAVDLLSTHCLLVPIPIRVNDVQINGDGGSWAGACPWPGYRFRKGAMAGMLGLPYETAPQSILHLLRYGVLFARRGEPRLHPPVSVLCENPSLRKNVSQMDVTEDEAYLAFIEDLQQVLMDFALEFSRQKIPRYHLDTVHEFLVRHFEEWLSPSVVLSDAEESRELRAILDVPMFHDVRGQLRTLRQVIAQYRKDGFLSLSRTRMPYAPVQNWVVLHPSPYEESLLLRLFGQVKWVERDILQLAGTQSQSAMRQDYAIESLRKSGRLVSRRVRGRVQMCISVLDDYPDGQAQVLVQPSEQTPMPARLLPLDAGELDVLVEVYSTEGNDAEILRLAHFALADHADRVYGELLDAFLRRPADATPSVAEERELAHLVMWWMRRLNQAGTTTPEGAREVLGDALWTQRMFRTRAGSRVSLADIETWLGQFETVTIAAGGPRSAEDHALDAGPALTGVLGRIFGPARFQRATLKSALLHVRAKQATLSGAADHPDELVIPDAPDEEEELLALLREEADALERPVQQTAGTLHSAADEKPAESTSHSPADAATPAGSPSPIPETEISLPHPDTDDDKEMERPADIPSLESPPQASQIPEAVTFEGGEQAAPRVRHIPEEVAVAEPAHFADHAFSQAGLMGRLLVPVDPFSASVAACQEAQVVARDRLFGLHVSGWVYADEIASEGQQVRWTAPQAYILTEQLRLLHQTLASRMRAMDPRGHEFAATRLRLLEYLRFDAEGVRQRMARNLPDDPLLSLPFLPTSGGTLATLRALNAVVASRGELLAAPRGARDPDLGWPVVVVDEDFSVAWYQRVFDVPVHPAAASDAPIHDRLLAVVQRELRLLREHGDFRLSDGMVDGLQWERQLRTFIRHQPATGRTEMNPDHPVVRRVIASFERDRQLVPVLVSSVYTAINRALEEVRDDHELAFLEALLVSATPE